MFIVTACLINKLTRYLDLLVELQLKVKQIMRHL
jgi:hypothetical protein